jgi:hypothetical protein
MAPSKRQTTHAKREREQAVRERRARKQQKKADKKAAAELGTVDQDALQAGDGEDVDSVDDETPAG